MAALPVRAPESADLETAEIGEAMSMRVVSAAGLVWLAVVGAAHGLSTTFTYQGQLNQSGMPATGSCDFQFSLFSASVAGSQIGSTQASNAVPVSNGLFTVFLDFGSNAFTGPDRWLQIAVRCPSGAGSFTTLSRQQLTAAPYALFAANAGNLSCTGCVNSSDLAAGAVTGGTIASGTIQTSNLGFTPVLSVGATSPLTSSGGQNPNISLTGIVSIAKGGTGASDASAARTNLGAAGSGTNSDVTALTQLHDGHLNTAAGTGLPFNTTGASNVAVGFGSLLKNTTGSDNNAIGAGALSNNTMGSENTALGNAALNANTTGSQNTALGSAAMTMNTMGTSNTAVGYFAVVNNTTGSDNNAVGVSALSFNTTGSNNNAVGTAALLHNTTGNNNTAVGDFALQNNTADQNTAMGALTLSANTTGVHNTATGYSALSANDVGYGNTAVGFNALAANAGGNTVCTGVGSPLPCCVGAGSGICGGDQNTAVGEAALQSSTGAENTAIGAVALIANTGGFFNTAVGAATMQANNSGWENSAFGRQALGANVSGDHNTGLGEYALLQITTGQYNTAVGFSAGSNLTNHDTFNIDIGNQGVSGDNSVIRIGASQTATYIAGIYNQTSSSGTAVFINSAGKLGTVTSAARFKEDIQDMGDSTSALMQLRPVRFRYKREIDPSGLEQYGLVAEEVAKVYPDLVMYDEQGRAQSVRYHFVNAMLLNEVQKQERTNREQARQIDALTQTVAALTARLDALERSGRQPVAERGGSERSTAAAPF